MKTRLTVAALLVLAVSLTGCMGDSVAPNDSSAPAAPAGVSATTDAGNWVVQWAANTEPDIAGYYVYRTPVSGTTLGSTQALTGTALSTTAYQIPSDAGQWQITVRAVDTAGNMSAESAPVLITMANAGNASEPDQQVVVGTK